MGLAKTFRRSLSKFGFIHKLAHRASPNVTAKSFLNQYFDRIVLFTIPRNAVRHQRVFRELEGINYEIFHGIDQKHFSVEEVIAMHQATDDNHPKGTPVAALSHGVGFWRFLPHADEQGWERVLFIEDDFQWIENGVEIMVASLREIMGPPISDRWNIVHFYSHSAVTQSDFANGDIRFHFFARYPNDITDTGMTR